MNNDISAQPTKFVLDYADWEDPGEDPEEDPEEEGAVQRKGKGNGSGKKKRRFRKGSYIVVERDVENTPYTIRSIALWYKDRTGKESPIEFPFVRGAPKFSYHDEQFRLEKFYVSMDGAKEEEAWEVTFCEQIPYVKKRPSRVKARFDIHFKAVLFEDDHDDQGDHKIMKVKRKGILRGHTSGSGGGGG